jgi:hypothetical protein
MLLLDLYWNVLNWRPHADPLAMALLFCSALALGVMVWLARRPEDRTSKYVWLVLSLLLLTVGLYALPAEPVGTGVVGREEASPEWYRAGRVLVLAIPMLLWLRRWRPWRKKVPT